MPLLTLEQVTLAYGHLPLFEEADLRIEAGERIALIGRNGSGKSSLLKVLSGEQLPDGGTVWRTPGLRVARLDQAVPAAGAQSVRAEVAEGLQVATPGVFHDEAWDVDHRVDTVISRLSLPADRPVDELSGGWRRRTLLGKALVSEPDLLLLDEPTNHLDIDAIRWLEDVVCELPGALLFVTHDRVFLDRVATRIIELDRGRLLSWPGTYATYLERKAEAVENEARDWARFDKKLAQEEAWLRRGVKARRTRDEGRARALFKMREERMQRRPQVGTVRMAVDRGDSSGRMVFEVERVTKALGGGTVIQDLSLRIIRGDRVGLIGPNGSGKTTLLRLLTGELEPDSGDIRRGARLEIAYFDQQREQLDPERSVADTVSDGSTTVTIGGRSRHIVGYLEDFLFPPERTQSPVKSLSGGERNRLLLARLFARPANVLMLDEPTNDLDIETLELLEALIADFDGTVLLVTHDRAFLDNIVTSTLAFEGDGRIVEYVGGYEDYLRQAAGRVKPAPSAAFDEGPSEGVSSGSSGGAGFSRPTARRKKTFNEEREYAALPARIQALEAEQQQLSAEAASEEFYKAGAERIREVLARIEAIHAEIERALHRWVELEEIGKNE
jgi:ATP-binding cassette subfamily F protein uup